LTSDLVFYYQSCFTQLVCKIDDQLINSMVILKLIITP